MKKNTTSFCLDDGNSQTKLSKENETYNQDKRRPLGKELKDKISWF